MSSYRDKAQNDAQRVQCEHCDMPNFASFLSCQSCGAPLPMKDQDIELMKERTREAIIGGGYPRSVEMHSGSNMASFSTTGEFARSVVTHPVFQDDDEGGEVIK